jgi:hypothetical protein
MFPDLFKHSRKKNRSVADAVNTDNWIRDVMHDMLVPLFLDYVRLWRLVTNSSLNQADQREDDIVWTWTANGVYSAKSAYNIQFNGAMDSEFPMVVWQVWAPSHCKFFIWMLLQNLDNWHTANERMVESLFLPSFYSKPRNICPLAQWVLHGVLGMDC